MTEESIRRLEELARVDPVAAPLALLQVEAFRAAADPRRGRGPLAFEHGLEPIRQPRSHEGTKLNPDEAFVSSSLRGRLSDRLILDGGTPFLAGRTLSVEPARVRGLFSTLAGVAARSGSQRAEPMRRALEKGALDPVAALEAGINQDGERLAQLAAGAGVEEALLTTLSALVAIPLLHACGERAAPVLCGTRWEARFCAVCAAWPSLAEVTGAERHITLRCGRCGTGWPYSHPSCAFCGNRDHRTLGYLAPESGRESRRAGTCDVCRGYLKTVATAVALDPAGVALRDLETLELDVAALERGYARPERPGFALGAIIRPA